MKKIVCIQLFIVLCMTGTFAQLKVLSNGRIALRGTNPTLGAIQANIGYGDNNGFCVYDSHWGQVRIKVTGDDNISFLTGESYPGVSTPTIAWMDGVIAIGNKSQIFGTIGGTLNVRQISSTGGALTTTTLNSSSLAYSNNLGYSQTFYITGDGTAYSGLQVLTSDSTLKKDIKPILSPLEKMARLSGVSYKMKANAAPLDNTEAEDLNLDENLPKSKEEAEKRAVMKKEKEMLTMMAKERAEKVQFGFLAQDMEEIFPDLVYTTIDSTKAINYTGLIAILVESMKEQQNQIEDLRSEVKTLKDESIFNASLRSTADETETTPKIDPVVAQCKLYQNAPNPFSQNTEIKFYIPENIKVAQLCIYNLQGKQIKQILITQRGEGLQWISGSELSAGMYLYALIVDGKEVDVKRMILTE